MDEELKNNTGGDGGDQNALLPDINNLKAELEECVKKRDEYLDGWRRAKADLINYKNEESARMESLLKFGNEKIIKDLIIVLDSFDLGLAVLKDDDQTKKGMLMIKAQFGDLLKKHGLEKIIVKVGEQFDPNVHEAVMEAESDLPEHAIVEEMEAGYTLNNKVLRATKVKISKIK